ncbi:Alpha-1,3/1,6-mannosyltransferase alg-2 [Colletotrichum truncatum]|uniref:Alpha-1,3/1,6-mannosyltransferase alg-2 n=1 Tax=Colletotrichum truncatum TaxID=5467 RepID=A0ACC3Z8I1_COLTU|nr:Alpha-1,3/1,6-mannosyltransferase alg-2 [Colletotrichum truncatum]KAF6789219.1 Alpha-1,3/1,6-mannosyltransferase alg-2 [Colletotrichum truncatum]
MAEKDDDKRTVVFFHPDLGIGGAERLVVDAAVGLQNRGHKVVIFTSHCDKGHCFEEARDGTLDVRVHGDWLPQSIFGRLTILCAILRQITLLLHIYVTRELQSLNPDAFIVDQLSAGLPLLQYLIPKAPILFYCHFPDMYLALGREQWWKRAYRIPFDWIEEWSMGFADEIAVNSGFTKGVATSAWPKLAKKKEFKVVYPCVDIEPKTDKKEGEEEAVWTDKNIILSINRFERKKDIALAVKAFAAIPADKRKGTRLVIAGGYDLRSAENYYYHRELDKLAKDHGLETFTAKNIITALSAPEHIPVLFLLSIPSSLKDSLLKSAKLLVYTPSNEHFGIVPLEAMLAGVPVLAANTGGPKETVMDGVTGWLREPDQVEEWTKVMDTVLNRMSKAELEKMGRDGVQRVRTGFGQQKMAERIDKILDELTAKQRVPPWINAVLNFLGIGIFFFFGLLTSKMLVPEKKTNQEAMSRKALVEFFSRTLTAFQTSKDAFRVVCTLPAHDGLPAPRSPRQSSAAARGSSTKLVVLDSSFNPPTLAHLRMAASAARATGGAGAGARVLLLLAVNNADKAPKPVAFPVRLGLMHAFARDLLDELREDVEVDLGLTTMPYFHDKSQAIADEGFYPGDAEQVYLAGYDTLIRIFNPKYYTASVPPAREGEEEVKPMQRALDPFLGRSRLRITMRTDDEWGGEEEQVAYLNKLKDGGLEEVGGRREWAERVEMVSGRREGEEVVSSTRVREAAGKGDEEGLRGLLGARVKEWVLEEGLYRE